MAFWRLDHSTFSLGRIPVGPSAYRSQCEPPDAAEAWAEFMTAAPIPLCQPVRRLTDRHPSALIREISPDGLGLVRGSSLIQPSTPPPPHPLAIISSFPPLPTRSRGHLFHLRPLMHMHIALDLRG
jgi:hypothetical protein